jgi:aminoglycoside phosphotransferase (APT) family kinase protein
MQPAERPIDLTDPTDPVLDLGTVLRLARRHVPSASAVLAVDESGGEARSYLLDDGTIFKTQRPHRVRARTSLAKAAFFMRQLEGISGISVPRVLGYGREGTIEYICETRMPGIAARRADLDEPSKRAMLGDLGRLLQRIHAVDQASFFASKLMPGDRDHEAFVERFRAGFDQALVGLTLDKTRWSLPSTPEAVAAAALDMLPADAPLRALHSNPGPPHAFVDPDTGMLTGLIDFGDAYTAHPAFDLRTWPRFQERFDLFAGYSSESEVDDAFVRVWRSVMILVEMTALASGPRPERKAEAEQALGELLGGR